ncbi:MAG: hypothetical protein Pg6C_15600 [Treponemataceae bacterium]|nr:MAG: hypothetical protein Pg6C_15600 [Treponemataceae bacterium]
MSKTLPIKGTALALFGESFPVENRVLNALEQLTADVSTRQLEESACVIADVFGAEGGFAVLFEKSDSQRGEVERKLIGKFHKNLQLLIKKSWVEKYDEALKEQVLCRLEKFQGLVEKSDYSGAYKDFLEVLTDTVYLMFGAQSKKEDFTEYALRIDPEFGVFWLYVKALASDGPGDNERCRVMLLLGMVFLANY